MSSLLVFNTVYRLEIQSVLLVFSTVFLLFCDFFTIFLSVTNDVNVLSKSNNQKKLVLASSRSPKKSRILNKIRIRTKMPRIRNTDWTFELMTKLMKGCHRYVTKSALKRPVRLTFSLMPIPPPLPPPPTYSIHPSPRHPTYTVYQTLSTSLYLCVVRGHTGASHANKWRVCTYSCTLYSRPNPWCYIHYLQ